MVEGGFWRGWGLGEGWGGVGNEGAEDCTYGVAGMVGDRGGGGCGFAFVAREHLFWAAPYHVYGGLIIGFR